MIRSTPIVHSTLHGVRTLTVEEGCGPIALFLDGDFYRDRIGLPSTLKEYGLRAATLSGGTGADRHRDFTCSEAYRTFLLDVVVPQLDGPVDLWVGVSLSGLAVAHLAATRPERVRRVIAQSPSAWWNREHLTQHVMDQRPASIARAWFSVGSQELDTEVHHPPTAMHQVTSQWESVTRLAAAWGPSATLQPYEGGHDAGCWAEELDRAVSWVMSDA